MGGTARLKSSRRVGWLLAATAAAAPLACGGDAPTTSPADPNHATIVVHVSLTGNAVSRQGITAVAEGKSLAFTRSGTVTLSNVAPGPDSVVLAAVPTNCAVDSTAWHFAAAAGRTTSVHFAVDCIGGYAYASITPSGTDIFYIDEAGQTRQLTTDFGLHFPVSWSPDGQHLLIQKYDSASRQTIEIASLDGTPARPFVVTPSDFYDRESTFSPDGSHVAFCRIHTVGTVQGTQIEIADATGGNLRPLLEPSATNIDCYPSWSPDGRRIALWTDRLGSTGFALATVNSHGTDLRRIGPSLNVASPTGWSFDGAKVASATVGPAPGVTPVVFKQFVAVVPATGGAVADPVPGVAESFGFGWSPRGEKLALSMVDQAGGNNYFNMLVNADGSSPTPIAPNVLSPGPSVRARRS
ncbi:MAG TPA: hypothetical protein VGI97_09515 [Gemmatimonadaceae bacterium]